MDDENQSIHEFDLNLICEYFSRLERQGPGSPEMTIKGSSAGEISALECDEIVFVRANLACIYCYNKYDFFYKKFCVFKFLFIVTNI
ncbi:MAG: hypothetical protein LBT05_15905 [Planctomycetaceae bacterium]|jgi:hypothetical protein|nr:hypothetical protein [Planctomycetaceae bacterium]